MKLRVSLRRAIAFTLIELLVVIAIIAILAGSVAAGLGLGQGQSAPGQMRFQSPPNRTGA